MDRISLFVHRTNKNFTDYRKFNDTPNGYTGWVSDCPEAACLGEVTGACIPRYRYIPANECFYGSRGYWMFQPRPKNASQEEAFFDQCFYDEEDELCESTPVDCIGYKLDVCSSSTGQEYLELEEWCIRSSSPQGEYTVPLIKVRNRDNLNGNPPFSCETSRMQEAFLPADRQTCRPATVQIQDRILPGSGIGYCSADSHEYVFERYADLTCNSTMISGGGVTGEILQPIYTISPQECTELGEDELHSRALDCEAPSFYCKTLGGKLPGHEHLPESDERPSSAFSYDSVLPLTVYLFLFHLVFMPRC